MAVLPGGGQRRPRPRRPARRAGDRPASAQPGRCPPEAVPLAQLRRAGPGSPVPDSTVALATDNANPAFRALVAQALTETGCVAEALDLLGDPVPDGAWNYSSTYGDCLRVDVLAAAGPSPRLQEALHRIEPWGQEFATYGSTDSIGSIEYFIGRGRAPCWRR